ncbi:hypothetical protein H6P81_021319 [Aristolochia fimbriata]|uniref:Uncharacterized protein n=1 Tax=Aristolochia fimbriata TaxID=158543 RepID=A0AAV7DQ80_ARIFI|nr:hypothetical protein H6P81_021319 [Aristolochia fimbriata]
MPSWATGAAGVKRPSNPLASRSRIGRRRVQRRRPRRSGTRTHEQPLGAIVPAKRGSAEAVPRWRAALASDLNTVGGTPAWRHARRVLPPRALLPPTAGGGGSPGRADWSPLPPWRGWLKTLCPKGTSHDESGGSALPGPGAQVKSVRPPGSRGPPAGSCLRGPRPCSDCDPRSEAPSRRTGRKSHGMGPREGDSPVVPDPVDREALSGEVGLFGNAAQIGRGWGRAMRLVERGRARAGPAADSGADRRWSRATQARADDPAQGYAASWTEEGGATTTGRAPRGHLRFWRRQLAPHSTALKHGPRSPTCVRVSGRPNPGRSRGNSGGGPQRYRRKIARLTWVGRCGCFVEPCHGIESSKWAIFGKQNWRCGMNRKPGYGAQLRANLEPTKGVGRLRQQDGGHGSRNPLRSVLPTLETAQPEVGSSGWKSTARRVVSGAPPAALENPEDRVPPTPGRTHNRIRSPRQGKSAKWIRNFGKRIGSEGWARGSQSQPAGLSVDCSKLLPAGASRCRASAGGRIGTPPLGPSPAEQPTQLGTDKGNPTA